MDQIGILGLGVMGRSLALNFARNGYAVAGYDVNPQTAAFTAIDGSPERKIHRFTSLADLVAALERPRRLLLMVPAGEPVDQAIATLKPLLTPGDIIIDGGNSFFIDTARRSAALEADGLQFIGMGVSGGEQGALWGPSLMPGGMEAAWAPVQPLLQAIAARAEDGAPCVAWMGRGGAGHYVKMVHNGIEYGDMQLIAEIYDLLHRGAGLSNPELAEIFTAWNQGELQSYLIEITARILQRMDEETGQPLVEVILDEAAQKGTGKWTSQNAFDVGAPIPTINAAVESRLLSSLKAERIAASQALGGSVAFQGERAGLIEAARRALYASKITSYAQGFSLLRMSSRDYGFDLQFAEIARVWRAGCIIRAGLLGEISAAFEHDPQLSNLMLAAPFRSILLDSQSAWRSAMQTAIRLGIPMLATGAALAYFDAYRSERLPANLTQAQRDFFGAHTYRRTDKEGSFHTQWEA